MNVSGAVWTSGGKVFVGAGSPLIIDIDIECNDKKVLDNASVRIHQRDVSILNLLYSFVNESLGIRSYTFEGLAKIYKVYTYISSIHLVLNTSIPWNISGPANLSVLVSNRFGSATSTLSPIYVINTTSINVVYTVTGNTVVLSITTYYTNSTVPVANEPITITVLNTATNQIVYNTTVISNSNGFATISFSLPPGTYSITITSLHADPVTGSQTLNLQVAQPSQQSQPKGEEKPQPTKQRIAELVGGYAHSISVLMLAALFMIIVASVLTYTSTRSSRTAD